MPNFIDNKQKIQQFGDINQNSGKEGKKLTISHQKKLIKLTLKEKHLSSQELFS